MNDPSPEAIEAATQAMDEDGWTCDFHEPDGECENCQAKHRQTARYMLTAAAPLIVLAAREQVAKDLEAEREWAHRHQTGERRIAEMDSFRIAARIARGETRPPTPTIECGSA